MTFKELHNIIVQNNIPEDVLIKSNSGWECGATPVGAIFYSPSKNEIHLVQGPQDMDCEYEEDYLMDEEYKVHDWVLITV